VMRRRQMTRRGHIFPHCPCDPQWAGLAWPSRIA